jgi:putative tricarboxylic transport membrane protein
MLLILNLPLIPIWVAVLKFPYPMLFAFILGFSVVGAYSVDSSVFGVGVMLTFGLLGYIFKKLDIPLAPFALTLILGPMMEKALRQSLEMSGGDLSVFYARPLTATLIVLAAIVLVVNTVPAFSRVKADSQL